MGGVEEKGRKREKVKKVKKSEKSVKRWKNVQIFCKKNHGTVPCCLEGYSALISKICFSCFCAKILVLLPSVGSGPGLKCDKCACIIFCWPVTLARPSFFFKEC
jgi:hypothetical protein